MAKQPTEHAWIESLLPEDYRRKPMFGGFAYYSDIKMILVIFEKDGDRSYLGKKYDFELWHGCMFPTEKENHSAITKKFSYLIPHPVLPKWLYLPTATEDFDSKIEDVMREVRRTNSLMGVIPKPKKKKTAKAKPESKIKDTKKPRMFSDQKIKK